MCGLLTLNFKAIGTSPPALAAGREDHASNPSRAGSIRVRFALASQTGGVKAVHNVPRTWDIFG